MESMTMMPDVKPLAVLIAGVSGFFVGGLWYGPLFAKPWMAANGFTMEDLKRDFSPAKSYGTAFIMGLIAAYGLAIVIGADRGLHSGAFLGACAAVFWVATSFATSYAFERRTTTLLLINAGYPIVQFAVMGAIIGLMQ